MVRFPPVADIERACKATRMNIRGYIFTAVAVVLLFVLMFYGGMFMHGD